jgi:putative ABC transport system permease protein
MKYPQAQPPRWARKILQRFCNIEFLEEIEGDLHERYLERLANQGTFIANLLYWRDTLYAVFFPSPPSRTVIYSRLPVSDSLQHFFKVSLRNLLRSKASSIINIAGLAISLTIFLFIFLYLRNESSYDAFHPNANWVYRISHSYSRNDNGQIETDARAGGLWAVSLKESLPEIKHYTRFSRFGYQGQVRYEDKVFNEQQFFWVDSTYTDIFSLPLVVGGDARSILRHPNEVIINQSISRKYFGDANPIGQTMVYSRDGMDFDLTVGGVMANYPSNASFHPEFIVNNMALDPLWKRDGEDRVNSWGDAFTYSFIELEPGSRLERIQLALRRIVDEHLGKRAAKVFPVLTKLTDVHFTPGMLIELEAPGDRIYLYIFGSIGILILLIASINYMNLATARSMRRAKEVGLRKTLGARRLALVKQFVGESILTTVIAFVVSLVFTALLLPSFDRLTGKDLSLSTAFSDQSLLTLSCSVFLLGLLSGAYPAIYLSRFRPGEFLKGKFSVGRGAERFRRILVVFQFGVSLLLIVGTLVIHEQLTFINSSKLNSIQHQVLSITSYAILDPDQCELFRHSALQDPAVENVATGSEMPRLDNWGWIDCSINLPAINDQWYTVDRLAAGPEFASMFGLDFIAGRNFSHEIPSDTGAYMLNESAVRALGLTPHEAIGVTIKSDALELPGQTGPIVGVVRDFNYYSARKKILPLILTGRPGERESIYVLLSGSDYSSAVDRLHDAWKRLFPAAPFEYKFLDQQFERMYRLEIRMGKLINYFSTFALLVACLGLFGLASFIAEQKTKEIGIRKVLGATAFQILLLLTSRFARLIVISFVIAMPVAFYLMHRWLDNFAYKVPIGWMVFALAGAFIIGLTYVTVGIESLRAAMANPVDSLRAE